MTNDQTPQEATHETDAAFFLRKAREFETMAQRAVSASQEFIALERARACWEQYERELANERAARKLRGG